MPAFWRRLKPAFEFVRDYWPFFWGTLGLGAFLVAIRSKLAPCLSDSCTYWVGVPLFFLGGAAGYSAALVLAKRRRVPLLSLEPQPGQANWYPSLFRPVTSNLVAKWYATNLQQEENIVLIGVTLEHPAGGELRFAPEPVGIPPGNMVQFDISGWVPRSAVKVGEPLLATVAFRDNRGRTHRVKGVRFAPPSFGI